ncbi:uncharacterized protein LOC115093852 isoform X2 [Rhinatrema bivittatum]|nr:uncharacterized protein LOC115093852 isoform X2 [Rhinatrema bivittatum]
MERGKSSWKRGYSSDRAFQDVYISLVQENGDLFESRKETCTEKHSFIANGGIKSSLTIHKRSVIATEGTKQKQRFSSEDAASFEEIYTSHKPAYSTTQAGNAMFPGCRVYTNRHTNKINIKAVFEETNLHIQNTAICGSNASENEQLETNAQRNIMDVVNKSSSIPETDLIFSEDSDDCMLVSSGESIKRKEFCNACYNLHNKMADADVSSIKNVIDANNWPDNFWIMKYPMSLKKSGQRCPRDLKNILKYLKLQTQVPANTKATANQSKCSRLHIFLQRNLQLCKKTRKGFSNVQSKKQRKVQQWHSHVSSKKTMGQTKVNTFKTKSKRKDENPYIFKVSSTLAQTCGENSGEESESVLKLAKKKRLSRAEDIREDVSSCTKRSSKSSAAAAKVASSRSNPDLKIEKSSKFKYNNSLMDTDTREPLLEERSSSASSFCKTIEGLDDADSDPFAWVHHGSFRDMLDMLNSGNSYSSVVRE